MKILKKIILLLAVTSTVVSCSKDDDIESVSGNKYETTYAKVVASYNDIEHTEEFKTVADLKENELYLKVDFRDDNTFWVYEDVSYEGDEVYEWIPVGTWSQNDSKITVTIEDDESLEMTVDGSKLIMIIDVDEVMSKNLGVDEEVLKGTIEWHFSKI